MAYSCLRSTIPGSQPSLLSGIYYLPLSPVLLSLCNIQRCHIVSHALFSIRIPYPFHHHIGILIALIKIMQSYSIDQYHRSS